MFNSKHNNEDNKKRTTTIYKNNNLGEHHPLHHGMEQGAGDLHLWGQALWRKVIFDFFVFCILYFVFGIV